ncbi:MAG: RsmB/NOP family class I SAM-dependent RNA methyltransferase [bacterium]
MRFNQFLETNLNGAIEEVKRAGLKADIFLNRFLKSKKIGKRDRAWLSDRFYFYFRHKLFFDELSSKNPAKEVAMVFENELSLELKEKIERLKENNLFDELFYKSCTPFLRKKIEESYSADFFKWLNTKSKVVIRANLKKNEAAHLLNELIKENVEAEKTPLSPAGVLFLNETSSLKNLKLFEEGFFEFQDESSQLVSLLVNKNHRALLDCCAGGGGKSLAIKSFFPQIELFASDIRTYLLKEIKKRAERARVKIKTCEYSTVGGVFDTVFIDAPCSGSGVLRRNPADRYEINEKSVAENTKVQLDLLLKFSKLLPLKGELIYATCSFLKEENESIVQKFLSKNSGFKVVSAFERLKENGIEVDCKSEITEGEYFRTAPFFERDLMFGAILKRTK